MNNNGKVRKRYFGLPLAAAALLAVSCTAFLQPSKVVNVGDEAHIHYNCRLADGTLIATSDRKVAEDPAIAKSRIFKAGAAGDRPVALPAGIAKGAQCSWDPLDGFALNLNAGLAQAVVGMAVGETRTVAINGEKPDNLREDNRYLPLARIWRFPKKETWQLRRFINTAGKTPQAGDRVLNNYRPPFQFSVAAVDDQKVVLVASVPENAVMETDWGNGKITEREDHFEVEIEVREGYLVRNAGLMGKVSEIGPVTFLTDYGIPFGGETLTCDIKVVALEPQAQVAAKPLEQKGAEEPKQAAAPDAAGAVAAAPQQKRTPAQTVAADKGVNPIWRTSGEVHPGDLVRVHYTASLADGRVLRTSRQSIDQDPAVQKAPGYHPPRQFGPAEIVAGSRASVPGLDQAVIGIFAGERKTVTLPPEKFMGAADAEKISKFPTIQRVPRIIHVSAEEFTQRFKRLPKIDQEVDLTPYYPSKVVETTDTEVIIENQAENGKIFTESFGTITVQANKQEIVLQLKPQIGAEIGLSGGKTGYITAADATSFTVDLNPPLAGESVVFDAEILGVVAAADLEKLSIQWIEDHEAAIQQAENAHKPIVMVLYAGWCGWSKRLLNDSLTDPGIRVLKDDFIWAKIDSDKEKEYYALYEQQGYPLIVLLNEHGDVLKKLSGYQDADAVKAALQSVVDDNITPNSAGAHQIRYDS